MSKNNFICSEDRSNDINLSGNITSDYSLKTSVSSTEICDTNDSDIINKICEMNKANDSLHLEGKTLFSKLSNSNEKILNRNERFDTGYNELKEIKLKNPNRICVGQININSLRNKFEFLNSLINGFIDIFLITECKLDDSFPTAQFHMQGYSSPFRLDRNSFGGGILLYVREDIPAKLKSNVRFDHDIEAMFIEINLRKKKWLLSVSYNPHKSLIEKHLQAVGKNLDLCSGKYENVLLMGDFNAEPTENAMAEFMKVYNLKNLIKGPTCYKNPDKPSSIDLILTNKNKSFHSSHIIETGISDFHKMTVSVMKIYFKKQKSNTIHYRQYKNFSNDKFRADLLNELMKGKIEISRLDIFTRTALHILGNHAPVKQKSVRANESPFMTKTLKKEIMNRSRLKNRFLKHNTEENKMAYNKQRNFCTSLLRKEKKHYFENLDTSKITDNKMFWKTIKPMFSKKCVQKESITLVNNDEIVSDSLAVAELFNKFFANIVKELNLAIDEEFLVNADHIRDPVLRAIEKYKNHPSVKAISDKYDKNTFSFKQVSLDEIKKEIKKLDTKKACQDTDIPTKILVENSDIFADFFFQNLNNVIVSSVFPTNVKYANLTPVHKKDSKNIESNYRPVSILSNISKIYERCLYSQISNFFEEKLSIYQCGFRKGYSAQHCLIVMIEKWRKSLDKGGNFGALLTDLSKAFDCLPHDLLVAKLYAYGFDIKSVTLIHSYLTGRKQRVKIDHIYSSWEEILFGVPQGSILGPLLFNIFVCDLFDFINNDVNIGSYADDTTPYVSAKTNEEIIESLENTSADMLSWFAYNGMKANPDKCHILLSGNNNCHALVGNHVIENSKQQKLLGVLLDNNLNFEKHISNLCTKASQKLSALCRVSSYMSTGQKRIIMKAFISSQFGYCPLVWMNHSRKINNRINRIHERALRVVYNDQNATFEELLSKDNSVKIHDRNLQVLVTEMFKVKLGISPVIMNDIFKIRNCNYVTRNNSEFQSHCVKTVHYGTESVSFLGPKIWSILPQEYKNLDNLHDFKNKIKHWVPQNCPCRLCKTYIHQLGFI